MKSIFKYLLLLILPTSIIGCENNEIVPDDINHSMITTSFGTSATVMQVNDVMSFVDLSRGVVSREWTFPEGAVTDTTGKPLLSSDSDNQKVRFVEFGEFYVKVKQVFKGNYYLDTEFTDSNIHEESIKITVFDSVRAEYTAVNLADEKPLDIVDGAQNEITAGSTVRFTVASTGNPATNTFTVYNATDGIVAKGNAKENAETGEIYADIQLAMPGVFDVKLVSSNDFGISTKVYTEVINVVASMEPIYLNSISRVSTAPSNVIGLEFSRGMVVKDGFSLDAFTVQVTNGAKAPVVTVTEISTESNFVNLTLSDNIYSSDVVLLSYDNTKGQLAAIDNPETIQESFVSVGVTFPVTDILSTVGYDAGFENGVGDWKYLWWGGQWSKYASEFSTAQKHSGAKAFRIEMCNKEGFGYETAANEKSGAIIGNTTEKFPVEAEKVYVLGAWTYIESISPNLGSAATDLLFSLNENTTWDNQMPFNADSPVGEWVYRTQQIPAGKYSGDATILLRANNADFAEPFIIYIDDLTLSEAEPRP